MTEVNAESLGMETRKSVLRESESSVGVAMQNGEPAILINRTIRSGTSIEYAGHVSSQWGRESRWRNNRIRFGFYLGKIRGSVNAGVDGDTKSVVCAMELDPIQLRIAIISVKGLTNYYEN